MCDSYPEIKYTMTNKIKIEIYRNLSLIRKLQEELIEKYHPADQMRCPMHFCIGQELMPAVLAQLMIKRIVCLHTIDLMVIILQKKAQ